MKTQPATMTTTDQRDRSGKFLLPVLPALLVAAAPRAYMDKKSTAATAGISSGGGAQRPWTRAWRAAKTMFFLVAMVTSLLVSSAPPLLVALLDVAFPCAVLVLLADGVPAPLSVGEQFRTFDFRYSLIDLPLLSVARSLVILGVYGLCDGPGRSRGPYLASALLCSSASAAYAWAKASVFGGRGWMLLPTTTTTRGTSAAAWAAVEGQPVAAASSLAVVETLLLGSVVLAAAHAVVAYRTSCRERRKLLVYRIDLEAIPAAYKTSGIDYRHIYSK